LGGVEEHDDGVADDDDLVKGRIGGWGLGLGVGGWV